MENKLNELTDAIRKALPRLMKIENGCIFKDDRNNHFTVLNKDVRYYDCLRDDGKIFSVSIPLAHFHTVLGKEPQLNDVLEWLDIIDKENK
jgi:hypothetical protein